MREIFKEIIRTRKISENKTRVCIFDDCKFLAIKSHVLQKNGIIREISENNKLVELVPSNPFNMMNKGINDYKLVGINDVYTFKGFCQLHDSKLFKSIEDSSTLNFENKNQQALFCYRGLCQEIRRKEIALEWIVSLRSHFPNEKLELDALANGYHSGLDNLSFF